jgi:SAM-dependent methyltransferase
MDRITWLREMRRDCKEKYDTWAPLYGEKWGLYDNTTHQQFLHEFLTLLPQRSMTLDAACGAGRYLPFLLEKGHSTIGIDQSQGMLARAKAKFPGVQFENVGLQEMAYREVFDGAICMDAMENVCPEDWPLVLSNFHRALKQNGNLYFTAETVENADENEIKQAFKRAQQAGLPVVYGEWPDEEDVYHYHPTNQQVKEWAQKAGFEILKEGNGEIWYYHILVQKV